MIDACDYSKSSIEVAKRNAIKNGRRNINYYVEDARKLRIDSKYSVIFLLGLTIYFENDDDVISIIKKVYDALKPGGKVFVKDSVNVIDEGNIFHCNFNINYQACYRNKSRYEEMWEAAGFKRLNQEIIADDLNIGLIKKYSMGYLFEK